MTERLVISSLGHRGDGIAEGPDGPIYVPNALPRETVEVEPWSGHPDRRQVLQVVTPSADRIAPVCPHFAVCGGCAVQHLREDHYRAWKRELVVNTLTQAGIDTQVGELIDAHGAGRRRATFHARRSGRDTLSVGFAAAHAHHIVPIDRCPILSPALAGALPAAWALAQALEPIKKPLDLQFTATNGGLDVDVRGSGPLSSQATATLARIAEQHKLARLTRHGELVIRRATPTLTLGTAVIELPPGAFLQPTVEGEAALAGEAIRHLAGAKAVVDLFCGVGPFALRIAQFARVEAFDNDEAAIAALSKAARTSGLKPVSARRRDLLRQPLTATELRADAVLFDPPRQGAEAQAREIAASKVPRVVAVSCNPATFARDARILIDGGYRLDAVTPIDQFRYSFHVEIVAKFER
jgi:23S rRNA (uracil1939-C5)-methyltransferase